MYQKGKCHGNNGVSSLYSGLVYNLFISVTPEGRNGI